MKFKYMIRGLGIGVIITAAVMGAYNRQAVADARVAVLKEYGIGEESVLVGETETVGGNPDTEAAGGTTEPVIVRNEEKESEIYSVLDAAKESEQAAGLPGSGNQSETQPQGDEAGQGQSAETQPQGDENGAGQEQLPETGNGEPVVVVPDGDVVQITIERGDDSGTISRKLHTAGLIENAAEYDAYLMQHGYDKKLSTGTKNINVTDNWQEIAEKLTRK